jgi:hypothetical protein
MTHPDILAAEKYGEAVGKWGGRIPSDMPLTCDCGGYIKGVKVWRMDNGDIICGGCIDEYTSEYFGKYLIALPVDFGGF